MIDGITQASAIKLDRMKVALVGEYKIGKDWLANTAPGKIFTFDFDDRADSLAKHPNRDNISIKTYYDIKQMQPQAWNLFECDVAQIQDEHQKGNKLADWYVLSSMQFMGEACMNWILSQNLGFRRNLYDGKNPTKADSSFSGNVIGWQPFGWDAYNAVTTAIENNLNAIHSIGNLICVFHEMPEKDILTSTPKEPVYTGKYQVYPNYLKKLLSVFNDQWRLIVFGGTRKLLTSISDSAFVGATSLHVDAEIDNPNITAMLEEHKRRLQNGTK